MVKSDSPDYTRDLSLVRFRTCYNEPKVQYATMLSMPNGYFVGTPNSYVDVATYSDSILLSLVSNCSHEPNHTYQNFEYVQNMMSTTCSMSFNGISNIRHEPAYSHSSVIDRANSYADEQLSWPN
jgi:hypothetical protein